ncbi:MAG: ribonuclease HI [Clostridia bacterium]|nr:ribonuclease HI [Clostridia bacterium]
MKEITVYTDGACSGNPGPGGWGAVLIYNSHRKEISGGEKLTTNNRMELTALIKALEIVNQKCKINIFTDSKYLCDGINKGWAENWRKNSWKKSDNKPAINPDLWEKLLDLLKNHKYKINWVKGHAGHPENELCDKLATDEIKKINSIP